MRGFRSCHVPCAGHHLPCGAVRHDMGAKGTPARATPALPGCMHAHVRRAPLDAPPTCSRGPPLPGVAVALRNMRHETQGNMPPHSGHFFG